MESEESAKRAAHYDIEWDCEKSRAEMDIKMLMKFNDARRTEVHASQPPPLSLSLSCPPLVHSFDTLPNCNKIRAWMNQRVVSRRDAEREIEEKRPQMVAMSSQDVKRRQGKVKEFKAKEAQKNLQDLIQSAGSESGATMFDLVEQLW
jgi:hypothetical protein